MSTCPICTNISCHSIPSQSQVRFDDLAEMHTCPRCGIFQLTGPTHHNLNLYLGNGTVNRSALSHYIRKMQNADRIPVELHETDLRAHQGREPPNPQEQADNLLLWIGDNQTSPDTYATSNVESLAAIVGAGVTPDKTGEPGFQWLLRQCGDNNDLFLRDPHITGKPARFPAHNERMERLSGTPSSSNHERPCVHGDAIRRCTTEYCVHKLLQARSRARWLSVACDQRGTARGSYR